MALPNPGNIMDPGRFFEKRDDKKALTEELVKRINESGRRIRIIEQRMDRIESSLNSMEDDTLTQLNDLKLSFEKIMNKLASFSEKIGNFESEILRLSKELSKTVTKRELKEMETFIDVINPVTSTFVTKDEMDRFVEEQILKKRKA